MKIITCAPLPPPHGGIANWYRILQVEAKKRGHTLLNIDIAPGKSETRRTMFYRVVVQGLRMLKQYKYLKKLIRQNEDVRVAHIATSGQLAIVRDLLFLQLLKRKRIKAIYHIHFGRIPDILTGTGWECILLRKALSLASVIIAIDSKTHTTLQEIYGADKLYYIPNPVEDISVNIIENRKNIVFLGNVLPSKGIEELLSVWEHLSKKYPEWQLIIVGGCDEDYKSYLENSYSMRNVEMLGYVPHDDAIKRLGETSFLVLPSHTEGFPNVVIEAMMCEKAVIATDVGAISEILSDGCGIVIQPKKIDELSESIERLINDPQLCISIGKTGREKAKREYTVDLIFNKYSELWEFVGTQKTYEEKENE